MAASTIRFTTPASAALTERVVMENPLGSFDLTLWLASIQD
jgi:hypothetical protein